MRLNGFDKIAWLYDPLARLVFGDRLMRAQTAFLHRIAPGSRVLILGGGTGAIAKEILLKHPGCHITFLDASLAMIRRAVRRLEPSKNIEFIHGTESSIPQGPYDVVITPFYLDMFDEDQLPAVIQLITVRLTGSAQWLVADFCSKDSLWHRIQLSIMYAFFRLTTDIQARSLPDWNSKLIQLGWTPSARLKIDAFIEGALFRRASP